MATVYELTKQDRDEIRQEKKSWNDFIRRMKKKGAIIELQTINKKK